ncbi:MAG: c-type cytochrome [Thermoanaerobaculia bacterium]
MRSFRMGRARHAVWPLVLAVFVISCGASAPATAPSAGAETSPPAATAGPAATPAPAATPTPAATPGPAAAPATGFDMAAAVASLKAAIAGKEDQPAETVFRNIQILKGVPAGRVLGIMQMGFSPALGVDCTHCHVPGRWESDEKKEKQVAREMSRMTREINEKYLAAIQGLDSEKPVVNCTTCHRGEVKPALNLARRTES